MLTQSHSHSLQLCVYTHNCKLVTNYAVIRSFSQINFSAFFVLSLFNIDDQPRRRRLIYPL